MPSNSPYTTEEIENYISAFKEETALTGINKSDFAIREGIKPKCFREWIRYREEVKPNRNNFVRLEPSISHENTSHISVEYYGAKIRVESRDAMKLLLSALKDASFT